MPEHKLSTHVSEAGSSCQSHSAWTSIRQEQVSVSLSQLESELDEQETFPEVETWSLPCPKTLHSLSLPCPDSRLKGQRPISAIDEPQV